MLAADFAFARLSESWAGTVDGDWAATAFLLKKQQAHLLQVLPPLQDQPSPDLEKSASLTLLFFTVAPAILDFTGGAEKSWSGSG